jgi:hypothetical protein
MCKVPEELLDFGIRHTKLQGQTTWLLGPRKLAQGRYSAGASTACGLKLAHLQPQPGKQPFALPSIGISLTIMGGKFVKLAAAGTRIAKNQP